MRRLIAWDVITLDGYFEGTTPWDLGFHQLVWGDELEQFSDEQLKTAGTLLFGRRTYDGMADYWSGESGLIADQMNAIDKAVASRSLERADWKNSRVLRGDAAETVRALKQETGNDIFVFGSADLLANLLTAELVDEIRLCFAPVALGAGTPFFKSGQRTGLKLKESRSLKNGGLLAFYDVVPQEGR